MTELKHVDIYTDGACSGNPGKGGWGCVLMYNEHKKEESGYEENTTNNRMELTAVIKALEMLKEPCNVDIYSDSAYVVNAFLEKWIEIIMEFSKDFNSEKLERMITHCAMMMKRKRENEDIGRLPDEMFQKLFVEVKEDNDEEV